MPSETPKKEGAPKTAPLLYRSFNQSKRECLLQHYDVILFNSDRRAGKGDVCDRCRPAIVRASTLCAGDRARLVRCNAKGDRPVLDLILRYVHATARRNAAGVLSRRLVATRICAGDVRSTGGRQRDFDISVA